MADDVPDYSAADLYCPQCQYNLRGITSQRCPECGYPLDFINEPTPLLPWVRRNKIGRIRAYLATVVLMLRHKRRLWEELARPASMTDALRFRYATIAVAYVPLVMIAAIALLSPDLALPFTMTSEGVVVAVLTVIGLMCLLLLLLAVTGIPAWFFRSESMSTERRHRAAALSQYCSAPFGLLPLAYLLIITTITCVYCNSLLGTLAGTLLTIYVLMRLPTEWLIGLSALHRRAKPESRGRPLLFFVLLPALLLLLGSLILICIPLFIAFVVLVFSTLA